MSVQPLPAGALLRLQADGSYRYRIRHVLGVGGFAITYRAEDALLHVDVAIKEFALDGFVFRRNTNTSLDAVHGKEREVGRWLEKFLYESRRLSACRHPRIVRVTDVWADENQTAYYAMDLIEGVELPAFTVEGAPNGPLPVADVQRIALELLDALDTVHEQRLVHCDLKPSNVLLTTRGEAMLIDFGAARAEDEIRRTVTSNAYTPVFAAPELQDRQRLAEVGPWTDLYGWAATIAACLVPLPASGGVGIDGVTRRIVWDTSRTDPWDSLWRSLERSGLSAAWLAALRHCLQIAPTERPGKAGDVLRVLRSASSSSGRDAAPSGEVRSVVPSGFGSATVSPRAGGIPLPPTTLDSVEPATPATTQTNTIGTQQLNSGIPSRGMTWARVILVAGGLLVAVGIIRLTLFDPAATSLIGEGPIEAPALATSTVADLPPTPAPPIVRPPTEPERADVRPMGLARLYGEWNADIEAMLAAEAANMAPEELTMMQALMGSMQIVFRFQRNGRAAMSMSGMGQAETKNGSFVILSSDSNSVRFQLTEEPGGAAPSPAPEIFTARFNGPDAMSLTKEGDPQVIPFVRIGAAN